MGNAYTPGLKVTESTLIRKVRRLPITGEVLVQEGQVVKPSDVVARTELPGEPQTINVAQVFGYDVSQRDQIAGLKNFLTKPLGSPIKKGEIIAERKSFFGLFKTRVYSPIDGVLDSISDITGVLTVRKPPEKVEIKAYIPGKVVEVLPEEGVVIETPASFIQGIFGVGGEREGQLKMVASDPNEVLTADLIDDTCQGKIVVGGSLVTADAIKKAEQVGARGIVVGGIIDQDLIEYLGYDIGVAITGQENIPLTLIITEGFGKIRMADKTFDLLRQLDGEVASINGATQIRAGVMRPEIIVAKEQLGATAEETTESGALTIETPIRIIREPYFGRLAKVTALPPELVEIETGAKVRVLRCQLQSGEEVTVPRANVEVIEG